MNPFHHDGGTIERSVMQSIRLPSAVLAGLIVCTATLLGQSTFVEDFSIPPGNDGWRVVGEPRLFQWNLAEQHLDVTWDSSQTNSYFYRPLGTELSKRDDFGFAFDLRLRDIAIGTTPGKPFTFQFAIGLIRLLDASQGGFLRGTGTDSPNLVEFDYFPDS